MTPERDQSLEEERSFFIPLPIFENGLWDDKEENSPIFFSSREGKKFCLNFDCGKLCYAGKPFADFRIVAFGDGGLPIANVTFSEKDIDQKIKNAFYRSLERYDIPLFSNYPPALTKSVKITNFSF
jgi:hypothetical protein